MHLKTFIALGAVFGLVLASSVQAHEPMNLISYPNAEINVDGDPSDWNLSEFNTLVVGGLEAGGEDWQRLTGTGDIAFVGWDEEDDNLFYAGRSTSRVLPDNKADHTAKVYARDNAIFQYFLVDITDDEINTGEDDAWANDSVEFYIDPDDSGSPTDFGSDTQLVIDAANRVQVWNSPDAYAARVEAGVLSAVTITETGWLLEVGIDKNAYNPGLPVVLGPADDPAGNNFGLEFSFRDVDDPNGTGTKGGDTAFTTSYNWSDPLNSGFPSKDAGNWGDMIAGVPTVVGVPCDFDGDDLCNALDIDALGKEIIAGTNNPDFDVTKDGLVNLADQDQWRSDAAAENGFAEPYLNGDANLDGSVGAPDLNAVALNWNTSPDPWSDGDFNADGNVNSQDLNLLALSWQQSIPLAAANSAVPEPAAITIALLSIVFLGGWRRRKR